MREPSSIYRAHQCAILAHQLSPKREQDFHRPQPTQRGTVAEFESIWSDLQGVPFSQGYLDAGGVRTRFLRAGDPGKPVLMLLHGSGGHAEAYVRNLGAHAEHFYTWSIDMLGHGYTDKPGHPLEVSHYVEHLMAVLRTIGVDRASVSGE